MVVLQMDTQLVEFSGFDTHVPASSVEDKHIPIEGVVPFDQPLNKFNVKKEMLLPAVCDLLKTPSVANPHK
jgi:hypothetical protein